MHNEKKIVVIGPIYPYKGGISHYTGMLCEALRKKYNVSVLSYSMQYPKLLFRKEQKCYDNDSLKVEGTEFTINTANPISWFGVVADIKKIDPDLVIIQWWHPYFSPCYSFISSRIKKFTKVLYTCHNVFPHERFIFDRQLTKMALSNAAYYIVHSDTDEQDLYSIKNDPVYRHTVIPTFNVFDSQDVGAEEARDMLRIDSKKNVLLFFGLVREYKGLKHLLKAIPDIKKKLGEVILLVVGDFGNNKQEYLDIISRLNITDVVRIYDGYVPDNEVKKFFMASDITVLPYESATQSGIVQISYSFGVPVVVTRVGGLPEVVENGKTGYVVEPRRPDLIADAVCDYFENERYDYFSHNIESENYKFSWDRMVEAIEDMAF